MGRGRGKQVPHETFKFPDAYAFVQLHAVAGFLTKPETDATEDCGERFLTLQMPVGLFMFTSLNEFDPGLDIIARRTAVLACGYLVFVDGLDKTPVQLASSKAMP